MQLGAFSGHAPTHDMTTLLAHDNAQKTDHEQNDHYDARGHGICAGRPAIVVEPNYLYGCQMHGRRHQKDDSANGRHATHEEVDKILEKGHL